MYVFELCLSRWFFAAAAAAAASARFAATAAGVRPPATSERDAKDASRSAPRRADASARTYASIASSVATSSVCVGFESVSTFRSFAFRPSSAAEET